MFFFIVANYRCLSRYNIKKGKFYPLGGAIKLVLQGTLYTCISRNNNVKMLNLDHKMVIMRQVSSYSKYYLMNLYC